jgi:NadR type nicotinamide-nucleotide adenylyltransferase
MTGPHVTRVIVTGSESTGKTTLAHDLASHFNALWVHEQSREYAEQAKRSLNAEDVSPIASAQIAAEDAALTEARRRGDNWLFFDTDLISTVVYARHYYGACPAWIEAEAFARRGDLYLLAEIDIPWTPDGVRDRPNEREQLDQAFREALVQFKVSSCHVRGLGEHRLASALKCIAGQESW